MDSKKLLRMTGNTEWIPNNCQVAVPLQPVEGILEIKAYKDLATTVDSFSRAISIQIKNFVIKCKTLNNDHYKFTAIEALAKALPNVAELLIAEAEDPPPINKHHLVAAYLRFFHFDLLSMLTTSVDEFQVVYIKTHNTRFPLIPRIDAPTPTLTETITPHKSLLNFLHSRGHNINNTPSTNSDTLTTINTGEDTSTNNSPNPSTTFLSPANKIHNPYIQTPRSHASNTPSTVATTQTTQTTTPNPLPPFHTPNQPPPHNNPSPEPNNPTPHPDTNNTSPIKNTAETTEAHIHNNHIPPSSPTPNPSPTTPTTTTIDLTSTEQMTNNPTNNITTTTTKGITATPQQPTLTNTTHSDKPAIHNAKTSTDELIYGISRSDPLVLRLHEIMSQCFTRVQVAYVSQYARNAIALNIRRVASKQRLENSANSTALLLANEMLPPPPKTITAVVNKQIQLSSNATEKRLQSLEDTVANERAKRQRLERDLSKRFVPPPSPLTTTKTPTPTTNPTHKNTAAKEAGASMAGASAKKSAIRWEAPPGSQHPYTSQARKPNPHRNQHLNRHQQNTLRNHPAANNASTNANTNSKTSYSTTTYNPNYRYYRVQKPKHRNTQQK
jgi:hypothetical protein